MKHWSLFLLLFPLASLAQSAGRTGADTADRPRRIASQPVNIKSTPAQSMDVSLSAEGRTFFLHLSGTGTGAHSVNADDPVIFLFDNDSTLAVRSPAVQGYDYTSQVPTYSHRYLLTAQDLETLSRHNIQGLRKHSVMGYDDVDLAAADGKKLRDLAGPFIEELKRANLYEVRTAPGFPGGLEVFLAFLNRNVKPAATLTAGEKTAVLQFRVAPDGSVSGLEVKQSSAPAYTPELLRVLKRMPKWKPALRNGAPVESTFTQPISFSTAGQSVRIRF